MDVNTCGYYDRGEKLSSFKVAISPRIYWSDCLSRRREGDEVKERDGGDRCLSPLKSSVFYRT